MKKTYYLTDKQINALNKLGINPVEEKKGLWTPKSGKYFICNGGVFASKIYGLTRSAKYLSNGIYRTTKEACELTQKRRIYNERLSSLAHELGGEQEWIREEENYYIYIDKAGRTVHAFTTGFSRPESVYLTKKCAIKICKMINSGEVVL